MLDHIAGSVFAVLSIGGAIFQILLALGMPWGHLAMGGKFPGRFPLGLRVAALFQAGALMALAGVVAQAARLIDLPWQIPSWTVWLAVGVSALSSAANLSTPSPAERRLWAPVALGMLLCSLLVALT